MSDMLSQAEIDALLNDTSTIEQLSRSVYEDEILSPEEEDAIGEIGNISMGTSATTLFTLLGQKVLITTPKVTVTSWADLAIQHKLPFVAVKVEYTNGLEGSNLLILKLEDVKIITDLMMGGNGVASEGELSEFHLSAIGEAMNQMIGSAATSMSSMFNKRIDISPPNAFIINFNDPEPFGEFDYDGKIVEIAFRMEIGNLIDSHIMQLLPFRFAKELVNNLLHISVNDKYEKPTLPDLQIPSQPLNLNEYERQLMQNKDASILPSEIGGSKLKEGEKAQTNDNNIVNVQPVQFQTFEDKHIMGDKENIGLIMDVPLEISVELGRTQRLIREILEFTPGSIIELDKLAGEPVDILVNGKVIAKGEVVVIDENFGIRITDIVNPSRRL